MLKPPPPDSYSQLVSNPYKLNLIAQDYLGEKIEAAGIFGLQAAYMPLLGGSSQPDLAVIPAANPTLKEMLEAEQGRVSWSAERRAGDLAARIMVALSEQGIHIISLKPETYYPHKQLMVFERADTQVEVVEVSSETLLNLQSGRGEIGLTCSLQPFSRYAGGNRAVIQSLSS